MCVFGYKKIFENGLKGMGSHISPFAEIQDVGGLLSINGFTMLTIVSFPKMLK